MKSRIIVAATVAATLFGLGAGPAPALEIMSAAAPLAALDDGMISKVVVVRRGGAVYRGGGYRGGVYRGPRGGVYAHGAVYRGGGYAYRGGYAGYRGGYAYRPAYYGGWARPGWYGWPAGGAIAAGAAVGVLGAAAAASYAGAPPAPGLCWYYTDPSRRQGFWDACR